VTGGWWATDVQVWWRDFDELGHMTAAAYPAAYEEGVGRFLAQRWRQPTPDYVVARSTVEYLHEVRRQRQPVTIQVSVEHVGRTSFVVNLVLSDSAGVRCSVAQTHYVAWDPYRRGSRPLTEDERTALTLPPAAEADSSSPALG
jgi:acyl-CoA thioester hydrolase